MKGSKVNRVNDRSSENKINKELRGESVESPTFQDKYKADLGARTAQQIAATSSPQTKGIWNSVLGQL